MSVTFAAEHDAILGYIVGCYCNAADTSELLPSHQQATARLVQAQTSQEVFPGCTDPDLCAAYGYQLTTVTDIDDAPTINMSNINTRRVLETLGLAAGDLCGSDDATVFLGRLLLADALVPEDAGVDASSTTGTGGMTVVECGRKPGYIQDRLAQLVELAEWCRTHGRRIIWG